VSPTERSALLVADLLPRPGVSTTWPSKRGMGSSALCLNDCIFAMLNSKLRLVVKLPKQRVSRHALFRR
jgi:hypothetical protein